MKNMTLKLLKSAVLLVCAVALASCSLTEQRPGFALTREDQSLQGPVPLVVNESFHKINLVKLIDTDAADDDQDLDRAVAELERELNSLTKVQRRVRRNLIQDRLIAASNQQCGEYVKVIKQFDAESNLLWGGLSTIAAGAGAIATPANTARAWSGLAAIFSGVRAEVNDAYFQQLTIQVIADGLEAERRKILQEIYEVRDQQRADLVHYGVWRAIGDAARYHANCSAVAGLRHAALQLLRQEDPGISSLNDALDRLGETRIKLDKVVGRSIADPDRPTTSDNLPLTAFLRARALRDALTTLAKQIDELPDDSTPKTNPTEPPDDDRVNKRAYDVLVEDLEFLRDKLAIANGSKKLSTEIKAAIAAADPELTDEKQTEIETLQSRIQTLRATAASLEAGVEQAAAVAEVIHERAKADVLAAKYDGIRLQFETLLAEAMRALSLVEGLDERLKEFPTSPQPNPGDSDTPAGEQQSDDASPPAVPREPVSGQPAPPPSTAAPQ